VHPLKIKLRPRKSFFQKHKRWLDFASICIVAGTFIANNVLRDRAKELADKVDRAQHLSESREQYTDMMEETQSLEQSTHKNKATITADEEAKRYDRLHLQYESDLNLLQLVPDIDPQANVVSKQLRHALEAMSDRVDSLRELQDPRELRPEEVPMVRKNIADLEDKIRDELKDYDLGPFDPTNNVDSRIEVAFASFNHNVLNSANDTREEAEAEAHIGRVIGYFLYAVGFIIALLGKLYGRETEIPA
jgi:hypothetical protein